MVNILHDISFIVCTIHTEMLSITGKQEEDLVSCNQRVNMMSLELMEANKKQEDTMKRLRTLDEQYGRLKEEKQQLAEQ